MDVRYAVQATLALAPILASVIRDGCTLTTRLSSYLPLLPRAEGGQPVLLIPGLFANDTSLIWLANALRRLGYRAETWGCGTNVAHYCLTMRIILEKIRALHRETGKPVIVIGHSLGGLYALYAAHECGAQRVRSAITFGSPVNINTTLIPKRTRERLAKVSGKSLEEHVCGNPLLDKVRTLPDGIPVTTIATQRDAVVGPDACGYRDVGPGKCHTHFVVRDPSHYGMLVDWVTLLAVLDRAAYGMDNWKPFNVKDYSEKRSIDHLLQVHTP